MKFKVKNNVKVYLAPKSPIADETVIVIPDDAQYEELTQRLEMVGAEQMDVPSILILSLTSGVAFLPGTLTTVE